MNTASVIVPVYSAEKSIVKLIKSLSNLDYPKELLEIIIVNNNSIDRTREMAKRFPVILLEEKKYKVHMQLVIKESNTLNTIFCIY